MTTLSSTKECIICGNVLHYSHIKGLVTCDQCGFITMDRNLSENEIKKMYSSNYYNGEEYADYLSDKQVLQKNFKERLKSINKYLNNTHKKNLFEIGCAYGFFLEIAASHFQEVSGIDISSDAVQYAKDVLKLNVFSGDFLSFNTKESYDIICMWDTIEHLSNPELYIQKVYQLLRPGGILCITTGDIGSLNARFRGRKWRQIHPPTHIHYFSSKTLSMLLEKEGFNVLKITYPSNTLSMNTILYSIFCLKSRHEKLYSFLKRTKITELNININLHDFMFVISKKPGGLSN